MTVDNRYWQVRAARAARCTLLILNGKAMPIVPCGASPALVEEFKRRVDRWQAGLASAHASARPRPSV